MNDTDENVEGCWTHVESHCSGLYSCEILSTQEAQGASNESLTSLPIITPTTHSHARFFFLEKTCWLPAEPDIMRHCIGHLGDVLIITADIYKMLIVSLALD